MDAQLFAGMRVSDLERSRTWYEQLLGEPSFFPNGTEAVWMLSDDRSIYIELDAERSGHGLVTVFLGDLDARLSEIAGRGLQPDEEETYSNGVRKAIFRDPDGNEVGFGGGPVENADDT